MLLTTVIGYVKYIQKNIIALLCHKLKHRMFKMKMTHSIANIHTYVLVFFCFFFFFLHVCIVQIIRMS